MLAGYVHHKMRPQTQLLDGVTFMSHTLHAANALDIEPSNLVGL